MHTYWGRVPLSILTCPALYRLKFREVYSEIINNKYVYVYEYVYVFIAVAIFAQVQRELRAAV